MLWRNHPIQPLRFIPRQARESAIDHQLAGRPSHWDSITLWILRRIHREIARQSIRAGSSDNRPTNQRDHPISVAPDLHQDGIAVELNMIRHYVDLQAAQAYLSASEPPPALIEYSGKPTKRMPDSHLENRTGELEDRLEFEIRSVETGRRVTLLPYLLYAGMHGTRGN